MATDTSNLVLWGLVCARCADITVQPGGGECPGCGNTDALLPLYMTAEDEEARATWWWHEEATKAGGQPPAEPVFVYSPEGRAAIDRLDVD